MTSPNSDEKTPCAITLLHCRRASGSAGPRFLATKVWKLGSDGKPEKVGFSAGEWFRVQQWAISDIFDLKRLLELLEQEPHIFVIRGFPALDIDLNEPVRRKKNPDAKANGRIWFIEGDGQPWALVDIDKFPVPPEIDPVRDPEGAIDYLIKHALPPALRDVTFVWQWSSSTGMQGRGRISAHFWFYLDRPMTQRELTAWRRTDEWLRQAEEQLARNHPGEKIVIVDPALFRFVQIHYTARPIFEVGVDDPLPQRIGIRIGLRNTASLTVPAIAPHPASNKIKGHTVRDAVKDSTQNTEVDFDVISSTHGSEAKLKLLGDGLGLEGFHRVITASAAAYVSEHGSDFDREALKGRLRQAIHDAPKSLGRETDIQRYTSDEYLDNAIGSAVERFGNDADARKHRSRVVDGIEPTFPSEPLPLAQAKARLNETIATFFDRAEHWIAAREEYDKRVQTALAQDAEERNVFIPLTNYDPTSPLFEPDDCCSEEALRRTEEALREKKELHRRKSRICARIAKEVKTEFKIESFKHPPRVTVAAAAGIGKTAAFVAEIMKRPGLWKCHIWIYVPTIVRADRLANQFGPGPDVRVMRGRTAAIPDKADLATMCRKPKAAARVAQLGLNVFGTLCSSKEARCEFYDSCPYIQQWTQSPGVRIYTSEYLHLPKPFSLPPPDLVVVDESVVSTLTGEVSFGIDRLSDAALAQMTIDDEHAAEVKDTLRKVREALESGNPLLTEIKANLTRNQLRSAAKALEGGVESSALVNPKMNEAEALRRLDRMEASEHHKIVKLLRQVSREYSQPREIAHSVEFRRDAIVSIEGGKERQARVYVWSRRRPLVRKTAPVLLTDADADPEINARLFGSSFEHVTIAVERKATVVQCSSSRFSKSGLLGFGNAPQAHMSTASKWLDDVGKVIRRTATQGKTLVVCQLKVRRAITEETVHTLPLSVEWEGATITHFGRIRGVDDWKDYQKAIIVGAEQPPPVAVEGMARAIWYDDPNPLLLPGKYEPAVRGYRLRSAERKGVNIDHCIHPDPRVQRVLELHRERGTAQAIDRLRLVHADMPKQVLILCNIPLDITVDQLQTWDRIRSGGTRIARAYQRSAGALPLVPSLLAKCYPDLYETQKSAERDLERTRFETPKHQIDSIRSLGVSKFRPPVTGRGGSRKYSRALLAADTDGARAQVEAAIGRTVQWERPASGEEFDPAKAAMIKKWERLRGQRIFWQPADGLLIEIARVGKRAVVPFCAYDHDDENFHDYIRKAEADIQRGYLAVCSLVMAGDEIVYADAGAIVWPTAYLADIRYRRGPASVWPETLIFDVLTVVPERKRYTFERPFLTEPLRKTG